MRLQPFLFVCILALLLSTTTVSSQFTYDGKTLDLKSEINDHMRSKMTPEIADLTTRPGITVSGLSSGAFFSVQLATAFSRLIPNAGIIAGGVFNAAQGNAMTAVTIMEYPELINMPLIYTQVAGYEILGQIDPTSASKEQKHYIFAGTKDTTLKPYNSILLKDFFQHYGCKIEYARGVYY